MTLLEPVGLDSRNIAQAWPAGSTYLEQRLTFLSDSISYRKAESLLPAAAQAIPPIPTHFCVAWSVCLVCLSSVTFVHPA